MNLKTNDLSAQAGQVLDRAAETGRALVGTGHELLDSAGEIIAGSGVAGLAGTVMSEAGDFAGEAGERIGWASETVSEVAAERVAPAVRSTSRSLADNRLLLVLLVLTLIGTTVAFRRWRASRRRQRRLQAVSTVREPDRQSAAH
jgi:hypothetical protein